MPLSSVLGASTLIKPGVVTSSTRPSVPYEGQLIYETDTDRIAAYNGAAWKSFDVNYTDISSTQTFSGFTKGNATITSKYTRIGDLIHYWGGVVLGSTSAVTGEIDLGLPVSSSAGILFGPSSVLLFDTSANVLYPGFLVHISTGSLRMVAQNTGGTYATNAPIGASAPFTWANGDSFYWNQVYQAA